MNEECGSEQQLEIRESEKDRVHTCTIPTHTGVRHVRVGSPVVLLITYLFMLYCTTSATLRRI